MASVLQERSKRIIIVEIKLSKEEFETLQEYASKKQVELAEDMKNVYFNQIEDEYNSSLASEALKDNSKHLTLKEVKKELGL